MLDNQYTQKYLSDCTDTTFEIGIKISKTLSVGDIVILEGKLGSGKTVLTKGIAYGLGIEHPVNSPSFSLVNSYDNGSINLHHIDLYRIKSKNEIGNLAMDTLYYNSIIIIEWGLKFYNSISNINKAIKVKYISKQVREVLVYDQFIN